MKVSYNWLQEYIEEPLPSRDAIAAALTMHSFEIESIDETTTDTVFDIKILPNRSHDCLSHYGIASEVASVMGLTRKKLLAPVQVSGTDKVRIKLQTDLCRRAVAVHIRGVRNGKSPKWLADRLGLMGQRPINAVVDITNYLTYALGQPTHAFDTKKLSCGADNVCDINIRTARKGERITLLDGKEYDLGQDIVVIADADRALDVAGVMGGKDTGVSDETTDILLTLCNFNPVSIRKTAKTIGIRTDASQRFENDISPMLIDRALPYALELISEIVGGEAVGGEDIYPKPQEQTIITVTAGKISSILGINMDAGRIIELLARQGIAAEEEKGTIRVAVPYERLDLVIPEDIAEEVGRLFGYENIAAVSLSPVSQPAVNRRQYVTDTIRLTLLNLGFSEIYTYAFTDGGYVEIENPIASDKRFLRENLADAMSVSLERNFKFVDLLGISEVKLFEVGTVFSKKGETTHLSIGVKLPKSKKTDAADEAVAMAVQAVEKALGISFGDVSIVGGLAEMSLSAMDDKVKTPDVYPDELLRLAKGSISYAPLSVYPFAVRDVAVFVPKATPLEKVEDIIRPYLSDIVVRFSLFDTFEKDDKISYAFRLVFQSREKTLTDEEINTVLQPIYEALKSEQGFEIR